MRVSTHPGEILRHKFLEPLGMSATALAEKAGVPANRITDIIRGRRGVTADTALRLGAFFDTPPEFWMNLQTAHDLSKAKAERAVVMAAHRVRKAAGTVGVVTPSSKRQPGVRLAASALSKKSAKPRSARKPTTGSRA